MSTEEGKHVDFPQFELVGPPCETPGCGGVLVNTINLKTNDFFKRCSKCGAEFYRMPGQEKLSWAKRTIERVLNGERVS